MSSKIKTVVVGEFTRIMAETHQDIVEHHRNKVFSELLSLWNADDVVKTNDLTGSRTLLESNSSGKALVYSNHRNMCPRYRLFDYGRGYVLECGLRRHERQYYINTIFLIKNTSHGIGGVELIFNFDRALDLILQFNAQRMNELMQLEK